MRRSSSCWTAWGLWVARSKALSRRRTGMAASRPTTLRNSQFSTLLKARPLALRRGGRGGGEVFVEKLEHAALVFPVGDSHGLVVLGPLDEPEFARFAGAV